MAMTLFMAFMFSVAISLCWSPSGLVTLVTVYTTVTVMSVVRIFCALYMLFDRYMWNGRLLCASCVYR